MNPESRKRLRKAGPFPLGAGVLGVTGWEDSIVQAVPGSYQKEVLSCQMQ